MKKKVAFFVILFIVLLILFSFLYFIGFINFFEIDLLKKINILDFTFMGKPGIIIYISVLSIFFILAVTFMIRMILSLKNEELSLTSMNIDDITIKKENADSFSSTFDKLVESLNKNINVIQNYTEIIDSDINKLDKSKIESNIQEFIDSLYQDFSHMTNDILQSITVSELFEKILYWGVTFSKSKRGSLMIVDKNNELYIYKTIGWSNEEKENIKDMRIPLGTGIAGKVASENKRIFVTNIENYHEHEFKFKEKYETKSFISMPIVGINKVVAVLNLTENKNGLYTMNELEILNIITKLSSKIFEFIQFKKKINRQ